MPRISISTIIKLADELEEQLKTLRSGDPGLSPSRPEHPPSTRNYIQDNDTPVGSPNPYGINWELIDQGPSSESFDPLFADGCDSLKMRFLELEALSRAAVATASTQNPDVVYNLKSETSLTIIIKSMRQCMASIQSLYEELP